jgi:hypothetical protein
MKQKGLFASICDFFTGLFSSESASTSSASVSNNDGLTGVERYIRNQDNTSTQVTGVEKYIQSQVTNSTAATGVEQYISNQASAQVLTGVEKYIRNQG